MVGRGGRRRGGAGGGGVVVLVVAVTLVGGPGVLHGAEEDASGIVAQDVFLAADSGTMAHAFGVLLAEAAVADGAGPVEVGETFDVGPANAVGVGLGVDVAADGAGSPLVDGEPLAFDCVPLFCC